MIDDIYYIYARNYKLLLNDFVFCFFQIDIIDSFYTNKTIFLKILKCLLCIKFKIYIYFYCLILKNSL